MARLNPPAPLITGDVFRLSLAVTLEGQQGLLEQDYMAGAFAANPGTEMNGLLGSWSGVVVPAYTACIASSATITLALIQCLSSGLSPNRFATFNINGTVVGDTLPFEVAAVMTKLSDLKGQHGLGRIYPPAIPTLFTGAATGDFSKIGPTGILLYDGLGAALLAPVTSGAVTIRPVIASRPAPGTLVTRAALVNNYFVRFELGAVRRRRFGRGI
jgi:hypothetical protein